MPGTILAALLGVAMTAVFLASARRDLRIARLTDDELRRQLRKRGFTALAVAGVVALVFLNLIWTRLTNP